MRGELVLVTGGSGFIGGECIAQLLKAGYRVRTTVRTLKREPDVRATLRAMGVDPEDRLSFAAADLTSDAGWSEAAAGCHDVLHVASPFPPGIPKHEDDLIVPARDGALRVLTAARMAGVRRVVMTSSFAAIGYGQEHTEKPFSEENWTDLSGRDVSAYAKSKTIAERAAWDFAARGNGPELAVVNPVGVLGPVHGPDTSTSIQLVQRLIAGAVPGCPRLSFGIVDVRDVADLHLRAMTSPSARDQRFLAVSGDFISMQEIALLLRSRLGEAARRVPTRMVPDWLVRLIARFDPSVAQIVPELGRVKKATKEKARRLLGWTPRPREDSIVATAESLLRLGLVKA